MASPIEFWPDQIVDTGVVRRVYFHALLQFDDGSKEWHYFGTNPASVPPTGIYADEPVVTHTYVQFPDAFDDLPADDANFMVYEIGRIAGLNREGLYE
jgi:hypothetical protein